MTSFDERRLNVAFGASSAVPIWMPSLVASFSGGRISPGTAILIAPGEIAASASKMSLPTLILAFSRRRGRGVRRGAQQERPALLGAIERPAGDRGRRFRQRQDRHRAAAGLFPAVCGERRHRAEQAGQGARKHAVGKGFVTSEAFRREPVGESPASLSGRPVGSNGKNGRRKDGRDEPVAHVGRFGNTAFGQAALSIDAVRRGLPAGIPGDEDRRRERLDQGCAAGERGRRRPLEGKDQQNRTADRQASRVSSSRNGRRAERDPRHRTGCRARCREARRSSRRSGRGRRRPRSSARWRRRCRAHAWRNRPSRPSCRVRRRSARS